MIAAKIVAEIRRQLAEGKISQREIARQMGVSRGTVVAIATGKRPDYETLHHAEDDEWEEPAGPPERCPGCGGLVYLPCRLCRVREIIAKKPPARPRLMAVIPGEAPQLNLRPEHHARYEEVCAWRREHKRL